MTRPATSRGVCRPRRDLALAEVLNAPELAVLDVLVHAAHIANLALIAQYPHLLGDEHGRVSLDGDLVAQRASQLIDRLFDLSGAVRRYRAAIANVSSLRDDDFPF